MNCRAEWLGLAVDRAGQVSECRYVAGMSGLRRTERDGLEDFGAVLHRMRTERGMSREGLACRAGVSASYIKALEKGTRRHPSRSVVAALARYLGEPSIGG